MDELLSPLLTTLWGRRTALGVVVLMGVLILVTLIEIPFAWQKEEQMAQPAAVNFTSNNQLLTELAKLPEQHLFGQYGLTTQTSLLPVTSLQIKLIGIIHAIPAEFSRVIISEAQQPGKIYQVGDILPSSGVKIYAITQQGVILNNGGRLEKLPLQRSALQFQGMPKSLLGE